MLLTSKGVENWPNQAHHAAMPGPNCNSTYKCPPCFPGFRACIHSIDDFMPACFAEHPRPDIDQLPCVLHAKAANFTALTFPDEMALSRIHEWPESDLNQSSLLGGDFGPE